MIKCKFIKIQSLKEKFILRFAMYLLKIFILFELYLCSNVYIKNTIVRYVLYSFLVLLAVVLSELLFTKRNNVECMTFVVIEDNILYVGFKPNEKYYDEIKKAFNLKDLGYIEYDSKFNEIKIKRFRFRVDQSIVKDLFNELRNNCIDIRRC